jgi:hypothetical protein
MKLFYTNSSVMFKLQMKPLPLTWLLGSTGHLPSSAVIPGFRVSYSPIWNPLQVMMTYRIYIRCPMEPYPTLSFSLHPIFQLLALRYIVLVLP